MTISTNINIEALVEQWIISKADFFVNDIDGNIPTNTFVSMLNWVAGNEAKAIQDIYHLITTTSHIEVLRENEEYLCIVIFDTEFFVNEETMFGLNRIPDDMMALVKSKIESLG